MYLQYNLRAFLWIRILIFQILTKRTGTESGKKDPDPKHSMKGSVAELELVWAALAPEVRGLEPTSVPTTPAPGKKGRSRRLRLHKLKFLSFWAIKKSIIITSLFWNIFTFGNYSSVPVMFDTSTRLFFFDCLEDVTRAAFSALTNKKIGSSSTLKAATPGGSGSATLIKDSKFWTHIFLDNNPTEHLIIR